MFYLKGKHPFNNAMSAIFGKIRITLNIRTGNTLQLKNTRINSCCHHPLFSSVNLTSFLAWRIKFCYLAPVACTLITTITDMAACEFPASKFSNISDFPHLSRQTFPSPQTAPSLILLYIIEIQAYMKILSDWLTNVCIPPLVIDLLKSISQRQYLCMSIMLCVHSSFFITWFRNLGDGWPMAINRPHQKLIVIFFCNSRGYVTVKTGSSEMPWPSELFVLLKFIENLGAGNQKEEKKKQEAKFLSLSEMFWLGEGGEG